MSNKAEFIVLLWHRPYREAAQVKGPFHDEHEATELAVRLVTQDQKFDCGEVRKLGAATMEVSNDE